MVKDKKYYVFLTHGTNVYLASTVCQALGLYLQTKRGEKVLPLWHAHFSREALTC